MRSFHCGTDEHPQCNPMQIPRDVYTHLKNTQDVFLCPNCLTGVHQCFKCKKEGVVIGHDFDAVHPEFPAKAVYRFV